MSIKDLPPMGKVSMETLNELDVVLDRLYREKHVDAQGILREINRERRANGLKAAYGFAQLSEVMVRGYIESAERILNGTKGA